MFHVAPLAHSRFGERFGYALWLAYLTRGKALPYAEIARAVKRTGPAVGAWLKLDEPPDDWNVHAPLADVLGVDELWLIRDQGEAPRPAFWEVWIAERRTVRAPAGRAPSAAKYFGTAVQKRERPGKPATKKGGRR
jgi:hypothetical protein